MTTMPTLDVRIPGHDEVFVGGRWCEPSTQDVYEVVMPSTEEVIAVVASPSARDADAAVAAARKAFDDGPWPRMSFRERADVCSRFAGALEDRMADLSRAWTFESGPTVTYCDAINGSASPLVWRNAIAQALALHEEEHRTSVLGEILLRHEPVGTVLGILPYNGPVVLLAMKVIPGLLAGCTFVIKHAPESSLTSRLVAEAAEAAGFPEGVVSVLAAGTQTTQYLVEHPGIDMVHITAGTEIAKDVVRRTSGRLARTALELGGKSAAIILDDAELDAVLPTLVSGAMDFSGQVCAALSRVLVSRKRYEEVAAVLSVAYAGLVVGDPFSRETNMGPLAVGRAVQRAERYVRGALDAGAKIAYGGFRPSELERGFYYAPTLLRDVDNSMEVAQQEIFGPVTCLIPYEDVDDAVRLANGTIYGLAASIYGKDEEKALTVAKQMRTGTAAVNVFGVSLCEPFGGVKQSGWGRECGVEGILEFTQSKQIVLSGGLLRSS